MEIEHAVVSELKKKSLPAVNETGEYRTVSSSCIKEISQSFSMEKRTVELTALINEIVPLRYLRNMGTIGLKGQISLLEAKVGVVGAGGLGGFVVELLARMGVGRLVVIDHDSFCDSNLNRQLLSDEGNLGKGKAEAAKSRVATVNSSVECECFSNYGDESNLPVLLSGCDILIDCLDNLPSRFILEDAAQKLGIVMIHGAIAGFMGQLAVIRPGRPVLHEIYGDSAKHGTVKGVEAQLGNPSMTPAMLASWQSAEAVKILAGLEGVLSPETLMIIDMSSGDTFRVNLSR